MEFLPKLSSLVEEGQVLGKMGKNVKQQTP